MPQDTASEKPLTISNPGIFARLIGAWNGFTSGWFPPMTPLKPSAPVDTPTRQLDYPVGYNINITPRANEPITFAQLRQLGDRWDLLRLLIEGRKDQVCKLKWMIKPKDPKKELDDEAKDIMDFYACPDGDNDYQTWTRMQLEDMLVIDAATLEPVLTKGGKLYALLNVDGSTISRKIDERGRTPQPPYIAYQQVVHGLAAVDFTKDQLIYRPRNIRSSRIYGYSPVEQCLVTINIALRRQTRQLYEYTEGTIPDAFLSAPKEWTPSQIKEFQDYFDARMTGNLAQRAKLTVIPDGSKPLQMKESVLTDKADEWFARLACFALSMSPTPFVAQVNRATAESAMKQALSEGLEPVMAWIAGNRNYELVKYWQRPDLEWGWSDENQVAPEEESRVTDTEIHNGTSSVDEERQKRGRKTLGMGPAIFTPQGPILIEDIVSGKWKHPTMTGQATPEEITRLQKRLPAESILKAAQKKNY